MILLITNSFPYKGQEYFLESEIRFWKQNEIILMPQNKSQIRDIRYEKYQIVDILTERKFWNVFYACLKMIFSKIFWKELKYIRFNSFMLFIRTSVKMFYTYEILLQYCSIHNITTIYTYWFEATTYAAILLKNIGKVKKVYTRAHGSDMFTSRIPSGYFFYRKRLCKNIDKIFCASKLGKTNIKRQGVILHKIKTSYLGVEKQHMDISLIKTLRQIHDNIIFVSCSNVIPLKRIDLIIDFLSKLSLKYKIIWYHIGDGVIFDSIKGISVKFEHYYLGRLSNEQVKKFYSKTRINYFIHFSDHEGGLPVAIQEALSYGIIPIVRDRGAISELVNSKTGLLLPAAYDVKEYLKLFINLLTNDSIEMRRNIILYQQNKFSLNNYKNFVERIKI